MDNNQLDNKFLSDITNLNRIVKRLIMMLFDTICVVIVLLGSFSIRLEYWYWPKEDIYWFIFGAPVIAIPVFISFRL